MAAPVQDFGALNIAEDEAATARAAAMVAADAVTAVIDELYPIARLVEVIHGALRDRDDGENRRFISRRMTYIAARAARETCESPDIVWCLRDKSRIGLVDDQIPEGHALFGLYAVLSISAAEKRQHIVIMRSTSGRSTKAAR